MIISRPCALFIGIINSIRGSSGDKYIPLYPLWHHLSQFDEGRLKMLDPCPLMSAWPASTPAKTRRRLLCRRTCFVPEQCFLASGGQGRQRVHQLAHSRRWASLE